MVRTILCLAVALVCGMLVSTASAQGTGALQFAQRLHREGGIRHDMGFNGPEVVYRASWTATRADAIQGWLESRIGHRELYLSGAITDIQCYGNVCVGRGNGVSRSVSKTKTVTRSSFRPRLFRR